MAAARKAPEVRREEILDAAIELVAEKGFATVTIRDVAAAAGVAHGLLRHYFASRDELMAAAFERAVAEEMELPLAFGSPAAALAEWLTTVDEAHYLVWIDAWSEAPRSAPLRDSLERYHLDCESRLGLIVADGVEQGVFPPCDSRMLARSITALTDGLAVQRYSIGIIDQAEFDRLALDGAERLLSLREGTLPRDALGS